MTRLELRVVIAAVLAATVVLGAVVCAAYGQAVDRGGAGDLRAGRRRLAVSLDRALSPGPPHQHGAFGGQAVVGRCFR